MWIFNGKHPACWLFWWLGAVIFASYAGLQYISAVSPHGWSSFVSSDPGQRNSPNFVPGGSLYGEIHPLYIVGAIQVLWTGLFVSLVYFVIPIFCYGYSRRQRNRNTASRTN